MSNRLIDRFGANVDLGPCLIGRNLNLVVLRGFAPLEVLAAISAPDVYDMVDNPQGTQRELDRRHARDCFEYAEGALALPPESDPRAFPEVILNVRDANVFDVYRTDDPDELIDLNSFSADYEFDGGFVGGRVLTAGVEFPPAQKNPQISRVDGNHRLSGVDLDEVLNGQETNGPIVPFAIYLHLSTDQEIKLFKDINGEHKGMDVTHLATATLRTTDSEVMKNDPATRSLWIASELTRSGRAFDGMVFFGGSKRGIKESEGKVPSIKLNTLSSTLKQQLKQAPFTESKFGETPDVLVELLDRYWKAVREVFPVAWSDRTGHILLQTIGLTGFARLGGVLLDRAVTSGHAEQTDFALWLQVVAKQIDLKREAWSGIAGAGGASRVAEALIAAADEDAANQEKILISIGISNGDDASPLDNPSPNESLPADQTD